MSGSIVEAWRERVAAGPDRAAIRYFDGTIDAATLDSLTDALATEFQARGVRSGDRIGIYLQNIPYYPLALLAVWKAGAIAVPFNPMYRGDELRRLVEDSGTTGIIVARGTDEATRNALTGTQVRWLLSASSRDFQTRNDPRVFTEPDAAPSPDGDLATILAARRGRYPARIMHDGDDIASSPTPPARPDRPKARSTPTGISSALSRVTPSGSGWEPAMCPTRSLRCSTSPDSRSTPGSRC